jgi:hypothetical protein
MEIITSILVCGPNRKICIERILIICLLQPIEPIDESLGLDSSVITKAREGDSFAQLDVGNAFLFIIFSAQMHFRTYFKL